MNLLSANIKKLPQRSGWSYKRKEASVLFLLIIIIIIIIIIYLPKIPDSEATLSCYVLYIWSHTYDRLLASSCRPSVCPSVCLSV